MPSESTVVDIFKRRLKLAQPWLIIVLSAVMVWGVLRLTLQHLRANLDDKRNTGEMPSSAHASTVQLYNRIQTVAEGVIFGTALMATGYVYYNRRQHFKKTVAKKRVQMGIDGKKRELGHRVAPFGKSRG